MSYDPNFLPNPDNEASTPDVTPAPGPNITPPSEPVVTPTPESSPMRPLSFVEAIQRLPAQYWRAISRPRTSTFAKEKDSATWKIIVIQMIFLLVVTWITTYIYYYHLYFPYVSAFSTPILLFNVIWSFVRLAIGVAVLHLVTKGLGGNGTLVRYAYSLLLFIVPLIIIGSVLEFVLSLNPIFFVPGLSLELSIQYVFDIYELVLTVIATMGVYSLSWRKATLALLAVIGLVIVASNGSLPQP